MRRRNKYSHKKYKYTVIVTWSEEDQGYGTEVPELPGCFSFGKTMSQAVKNITDAIESWMEAAEDAHLSIPEPLVTRKFSGKFNLRVNPELHRALAIKAKKKRKSLNAYIHDLLQERAA